MATTTKKVTLENILLTFAETVNDRFKDTIKTYEDIAKVNTSELSEIKVIMKKQQEFLDSINSLLKLAQVDIDLLHKLSLQRAKTQFAIENESEELEKDQQ